ncbi:sumo-activating enzyme subunit 1b-2 [Nicotiana attenuata]|uniref:Sumo-activating enzyme subunit 1b-2 n=1 Tax=Nicotiana attenuata TaxID=49451 RepID=A0A1J6KY69_NICAT|nr:sumo-activating enzyme subunit 1b-2 [Nicotiana attenuata]
MFFLQSELNLRLLQLPKPVAFYSVECRGFLAEIFVDPNNQIKSERLFGETVDTILEFPSSERAIAVPSQELPQGMSKVYYAMRFAENFEATNGRFLGELYDADIENIKTFKD